MQIEIDGAPYQIDEYGNVNKRRGKGFVKPTVDKDGYLRISFGTKENKTVNRSVHRLVYEAFIGEIPEGVTVDHIDSDKSNNHYTNLQLLSQVENVVKGNARHWVLQSPAGERVEVYNLRQFCRTHNLHQSHLYDVLNEKPNYNAHKGWRKYYE